MTSLLKQKPAHKVRFGNVQVAIWANKTKDGSTFHSFELRRSYRDQDGHWHDQKMSLRLNEIAKIIGALNKAYADYHTLPQFKKTDEDSADSTEGAAQ